ncbi:SH3 domain-containing protein [Roseovarius sp. ZX-A-9]|uniref:SH3 domain-containing protein n=1 Tax=Roseovarius sp. ZX-A-9 TaxID=3014783 RepID=UPI00232E388D|nr:SH3 domain-containing protein [Roseovarius sp. ZX-A-9]
MKRDLRKAGTLVMLIVGILGTFGSLFSEGEPGAPPPKYQTPSQTFQPKVKDASTATLYVTGSRVNQRSGPSTGNSVMGTLKKGTAVKKVGAQGDWIQIASPLGTGWMSSRYLSSQTPTSVSKARHGGRIVKASEIEVIDGDTVVVIGERANVRLVGFNTPETYKPSCSAERDAGRRAKQRLSKLLRSANVIEFAAVRCSCRPGTHGTQQCNFGRQCGSLYVDGTDVGRILISEALADPYVCGPTSCPRRQNSWCQ